MNRRMMALGLAAAIALPAAASAAETPIQPRIVVTGEGEAAIAPDMALLSLSVMREAKTAREALDANNAAMAEVIEAIKVFGIADRDLQTSGLQIMPRYNYTNKPDGTQEAELIAYQVTNTLSVRVRDLVRSRRSDARAHPGNLGPVLRPATNADGGQGVRPGDGRGADRGRREFLPGPGQHDLRTEVAGEFR